MILVLTRSIFAKASDFKDFSFTPPCFIDRPTDDILKQYLEEIQGLEDQQNIQKLLIEKFREQQDFSVEMDLLSLYATSQKQGIFQGITYTNFARSFQNFLQIVETMSDKEIFIFLSFLEFRGHAYIAKTPMKEFLSLENIKNHVKFLHTQMLLSGEVALSYLKLDKLTNSNVGSAKPWFELYHSYVDRLENWKECQEDFKAYLEKKNEVFSQDLSSYELKSRLNDWNKKYQNLVHDNLKRVNQHMTIDREIFHKNNVSILCSIHDYLDTDKIQLTQTVDFIEFCIDSIRNNPNIDKMIQFLQHLNNIAQNAQNQQLINQTKELLMFFEKNKNMPISTDKILQTQKFILETYGGLISVEEIQNQLTIAIKVLEYENQLQNHINFSPTDKKEMDRSAITSFQQFLGWMEIWFQITEQKTNSFLAKLGDEQTQITKKDLLNNIFQAVFETTKITQEVSWPMFEDGFIQLIHFLFRLSKLSCINSTLHVEQLSDISQKPEDKIDPKMWAAHKQNKTLDGLKQQLEKLNLWPKPDGDLTEVQKNLYKQNFSFIANPLCESVCFFLNSFFQKSNALKFHEVQQQLHEPDEFYKTLSEIISFLIALRDKTLSLSFAHPAGVADVFASLIQSLKLLKSNFPNSWQNYQKNTKDLQLYKIFNIQDAIAIFQNLEKEEFYENYLQKCLPKELYAWMKNIATMDIGKITPQQQMEFIANLTRMIQQRPLGSKYHAYTPNLSLDAPVVASWGNSTAETTLDAISEQILQQQLEINEYLNYFQNMSSNQIIEEKIDYPQESQESQNTNSSQTTQGVYSQESQESQNTKNSETTKKI